MKLYDDLVARFEKDLPQKTRALVMLGLGEARFKSGDLQGALQPLSDASDLDPETERRIDEEGLRPDYGPLTIDPAVDPQSC